jgi:hypothetical protein
MLRGQFGASRKALVVEGLSASSCDNNRSNPLSNIYRFPSAVSVATTIAAVNAIITVVVIVAISKGAVLIGICSFR